jgi:hypothetical protein
MGWALRLQELDHVEVIGREGGFTRRGIVGVIKNEVARIDFVDAPAAHKALTEGDAVQVLVKRHNRLFTFWGNVRRAYPKAMRIAVPARLVSFERRQDVRENCDLLAYWRRTSHGWPNSARVINISMGGLLLETLVEPPAIGELYLGFHIPRSSKPVPAYVSVRHRRREIRWGQHVWLFGLGFRGLKYTDKRRVWTLIQRLQRQRALSRRRAA